MVKTHTDAHMLLSPGLNEAPVLDRMCSQFVLALTMRNSARFNLRRESVDLREWLPNLVFRGSPRQKEGVVAHLTVSSWCFAPHCPGVI